MSDIKGLKDAYEEGWRDGHDQGITCGHDLSPRCVTKKELADDFECSDTSEALEIENPTDDVLIEEPKPCPFCGEHLVKKGDRFSAYYEHPENECILGLKVLNMPFCIGAYEENITIWNTRHQSMGSMTNGQ